jgi:hypothetical protein
MSRIAAMNAASKEHERRLYVEGFKAGQESMRERAALEGHNQITTVYGITEPAEYARECIRILRIEEPSAS